ncbi:hypothetical protein RN001_015680 [Aquatica leii]|uniref:Uncharacterized protein n=1 Tax=Aquatica leii TaxID=1421715 RepID=A0AAN7NYC8_9COLE|nr:hypothetical protein RN001_015680 [Aquatica leii]
MEEKSLTDYIKSLLIDTTFVGTYTGDKKANGNTVYSKILIKEDNFTFTKNLEETRKKIEESNLRNGWIGFGDNQEPNKLFVSKLETLKGSYLFKVSDVVINEEEMFLKLSVVQHVWNICSFFKFIVALLQSIVLIEILLVIVFFNLALELLKKIVKCFCTKLSEIIRHIKHIFHM